MTNAIISLKGYLYVVLAAILWASSGSLSKYLFMGGVTPFQLVQLRTTTAVVLIASWFVFQNQRAFIIDKKDLGYFIILGISLAIAQFTYLYAISRINVAAAILLQYQSPVLIAIYSVLWEKKKMTLYTAGATAGAVAGCYLMVGAYNFDVFNLNRAGLASGLASAATFALYTVRSEYGMRTYSPGTVVFYAFVFAAVCWNLLQPPFSAFMNGYSPGMWKYILFVCTFGTILPFWFYSKGVHLISSTHASVTATLEPVTAGALSYFFLGEILTPIQVAGAVCVILSVIILQLRKNNNG